MALLDFACVNYIHRRDPKKRRARKLEKKSKMWAKGNSSCLSMDSMFSTNSTLFTPLPSRSPSMDLGAIGYPKSKLVNESGIELVFPVSSSDVRDGNDLDDVLSTKSCSYCKQNNPDIKKRKPKRSPNTSVSFAPKVDERWSIGSPSSIPTIRLPDRSLFDDNCQNYTFGFSYFGTPQDIAFTIDYKSRFLFPLAFFAFNLSYWFYVLYT